MRNWFMTIQVAGAGAIAFAFFNGAIEMWRAHVEADRTIHNGAVLHSIEAAVWLLVVLYVTMLRKVAEYDK